MRLFLAGPAGPDQVATKRLLIERGYRVLCTSDVEAPSYPFNHGMQPTARQVRQQCLWEMMNASVVVVEDDLERNEMRHIHTVCSYGQLRMVMLLDLPALCPPVTQEEAILDAIDMVRPDNAPAPQSFLATVREQLVRFANWFDRTCGWFFTNGNKQGQPRPRPYTVPETISHTA